MFNLFHGCDILKYQCQIKLNNIEHYLCTITTSLYLTKYHKTSSGRDHYDKRRAITCSITFNIHSIVTFYHKVQFKYEKNDMKWGSDEGQGARPVHKDTCTSLRFNTHQFTSAQSIVRNVFTTMLNCHVLHTINWMTNTVKTFKTNCMENSCIACNYMGFCNRALSHTVPGTLEYQH